MDTMSEHDTTPRKPQRQFKQGKRAGRAVVPPKGGRGMKRGKRKMGRS